VVDWATYFGDVSFSRDIFTWENVENLPNVVAGAGLESADNNASLMSVPMTQIEVGVVNTDNDSGYLAFIPTGNNSMVYCIPKGSYIEIDNSNRYIFSENSYRESSDSAFEISDFPVNSSILNEDFIDIILPNNYFWDSLPYELLGLNNIDDISELEGINYKQSRKSLVQNIISLILNKAEIDNIPDVEPLINRVTDIENQIETIDSTATTAINKVAELDNQIEIIDNIVKGANQALAFENYPAVLTFLGNAGKNQYNIGQNIMVTQLNVPDLWISGRSEEFISTEIMFTDEEFIQQLNTPEGVRVGYYTLHQLETQKVNLNDYVTKESIEIKNGAVQTDNEILPNRIYNLIDGDYFRLQFNGINWENHQYAYINFEVSATKASPFFGTPFLSSLVGWSGEELTYQESHDDIDFYVFTEEGKYQICIDSRGYAACAKFEPVSSFLKGREATS
jgi:hypothetical protein